MGRKAPSLPPSLWGINTPRKDLSSPRRGSLSASRRLMTVISGDVRGFNVLGSGEPACAAAVGQVCSEEPGPVVPRVTRVAKRAWCNWMRRRQLKSDVGGRCL